MLVRAFIFCASFVSPSIYLSFICHCEALRRVVQRIVECGKHNAISHLHLISNFPFIGWNYNKRIHTYDISFFCCCFRCSMNACKQYQNRNRMEKSYGIITQCIFQLKPIVFNLFQQIICVICFFFCYFCCCCSAHL